jgi:hypothetical protein
MPESKNYLFTYQELAELMIKNLNLHEGLWGIYVEYNLGAANIALNPANPDPKVVAPASIAMIKSIGLQRFDAPNNLTVDAGVVNPEQPMLEL